jgi:hypothetical protein
MCFPPIGLASAEVFPSQGADGQRGSGCLDRDQRLRRGPLPVTAPRADGDGNDG